MTSLMSKILFLKIREFVLGLAKKKLVQYILFKFLGGAIGGIGGFIFNIAFNYGWKKLIVPGYYLITRKLFTWVKSFGYKKKAKALNDSKTEDEFDSASDDMV